MIRAKRAPRHDAACHSADVLTPTERAANNLPKGFAKPSQLVFREHGMRWGDDPEIRALLLSIREKTP